MSAKSILVVEDDGTIRDSLRELLEGEGYVVATAANGREGLDSIRRLGGRCLVLLDLQMPIMTGEQLLDSLARERDPVIRGVEVLVLTARVEGLARAGVLDVVRKPIDVEELLEKVALHSR